MCNLNLRGTNPWDEWRKCVNYDGQHRKNQRPSQARVTRTQPPLGLWLCRDLLYLQSTIKSNINDTLIPILGQSIESTKHNTSNSAITTSYRQYHFKQVLDTSLEKSNEDEGIQNQENSLHTLENPSYNLISSTQPQYYYATTISTSLAFRHSIPSPSSFSDHHHLEYPEVTLRLRLLPRLPYGLLPRLLKPYGDR